MARRIESGKLRHKVLIQSHSSTGYDSYGQLSASSSNWHTTVRLRAAIEPLRADEAELARQRYPNVTHKVTTEYTSTLNTAGATERRLIFGSRIFHVGAIINPDEENRHLELLCGEER